VSYDPNLMAADATLQRAFDSIENSGLEVFEPERVALSHAAEAGHLPALERLVRRALLLGSAESRAAENRRAMRAHRAEVEQAPAKTAPIPDPTPSPAPAWELVDGGTGFRHFRCGGVERGFVDDVQAKATAKIHDRTCPVTTEGRQL